MKIQVILFLLISLLLLNCSKKENVDLHLCDGIELVETSTIDKVSQQVIDTAVRYAGWGSTSKTATKTTAYYINQGMINALNPQDLEWTKELVINILQSHPSLLADYNFKTTLPDEIIAPSKSWNYRYIREGKMECLINNYGRHTDNFFDAIDQLYGGFGNFEWMQYMTPPGFSKDSTFAFNVIHIYTRSHDETQDQRDEFWLIYERNDEGIYEFKYIHF